MEAEAKSSRRNPLGENKPEEPAVTEMPADQLMRNEFLVLKERIRLLELQTQRHVDEDEDHYRNMGIGHTSIPPPFSCNFSFLKCQIEFNLQTFYSAGESGVLSPVTFESSFE